MTELESSARTLVIKTVFRCFMMVSPFYCCLDALLDLERAG